MRETVTFPAGAVPLGETMSIRAPREWHERIAALSPRCCYGPDYRRPVVDALVAMSYALRDGYSTVAYDHLLVAERAS